MLFLQKVPITLLGYFNVLSDGASDLSCDFRRRGKGNIYYIDTTYDT